MEGLLPGRDTPRRRARRLLRGQAGGEPLILPIAVGIGARVEGWEVKEFLENPNHLARASDLLHKAAGLDAIFVAGPSGAEAQALGAVLDWQAYPPQVTARLGAMPGDDAIASLFASPRIQASLEAARRLTVTACNEPLLAAAITGPWTMAGQLAGPGWERDASGGSWLGFCGRVAVDLARRYCEAGCDLVVLAEEAGPLAGTDLYPEWEAALVPTINMLQFHRKLLVTIANGQAIGRGFSAVAISPQPESWNRPGCAADVLVTDGELSFGTDLTRLREQAEALRRSLT